MIGTIVCVCVCVCVSLPMRIGETEKETEKEKKKAAHESTRNPNKKQKKKKPAKQNSQEKTVVGCAWLVWLGCLVCGSKFHIGCWIARGMRDFRR